MFEPKFPALPTGGEQTDLKTQTVVVQMPLVEASDYILKALEADSDTHVNAASYIARNVPAVEAVLVPMIDLWVTHTFNHNSDIDVSQVEAIFKVTSTALLEGVGPMADDTKKHDIWDHDVLFTMEMDVPDGDRPAPDGVIAFVPPHVFTQQRHENAEGVGEAMLWAMVAGLAKSM